MGPIALCYPRARDQPACADTNQETAGPPPSKMDGETLTSSKVSTTIMRLASEELLAGCLCVQVTHLAGSPCAPRPSSAGSPGFSRRAGQPGAGRPGCSPGYS